MKAPNKKATRSGIGVAFEQQIECFVASFLSITTAHELFCRFNL
ncbi:hypothetical protein QUF63_04845 [Anaerolineales bacterium HSG25]|nr:hypothetical protein [Anaerolineales bacterium HSG25]